MRLILFIFILLGFSCKENKGYVSKEENGGDEVYSIENDDNEMNLAIEKAQRTFSQFITNLKKNDSSCSDFSVKMKFEYDENNGEHMWLSNLYFDKDSLFGVLNSDPVNVVSVKAGDTLQIISNNVSDWMYIKGRKMVGGYTVKALYNKMSDKEKEEFRQELGFKIE
jgi:uncharacterized protein YegJ (DUF2314 family)